MMTTEFKYGTARGIVIHHGDWSGDATVRLVNAANETRGEAVVNGDRLAKGDPTAAEMSRLALAFPVEFLVRLAAVCAVRRLRDRMESTVETFFDKQPYY